MCVFFFFFQAEDGIRDVAVTGVQTCALPIYRWVGRGPALRLKHADGRTEERSFEALADWSSRFANFLEADGVAKGDRVAVMLDPSLAFYGAVFGILKRGAVAVPLFTLLGPDGVRLRVDDCRPRLVLVGRDAERWQGLFPRVGVIAVDDRFLTRLAGESPRYVPATRADDLAVLQYTSGTTRGFPEAVRHTHRAIVTLMVAALYGLGLRRGDRYFCPSSPAWGHGLWHGTIAPLALGVAVGAYSGKFHAGRLLEALEEFHVTNLAAAPPVFRMLRASGLAEGRRLALERISFRGEPMDSRTWEWIEKTIGVTPCSMYGSTEVGVIIVNYPGFAGYVVKPGALGRPAPGWEVAIVDTRGEPAPPGTVGEIAVRRKGGWFPVKDRGWMDAEGYVHHEGRSDDVIVPAGGQARPAGAPRAGGRARVSRFPTISDEALGALRALVGKEIRRPEPYVEVATRDAIRHWAHGIGDRNPLWAAARLAPPTILFAMDRIVSGYVTGLPGIHAMYAGSDFRWRRAVREGDRVLGRSVLLDLEEKASTFARRAIRQTYRTTFVDDAEAIVCEADSWCFRTERDTARELQKYRALEPHRYAPEEIERIRRAYAGEAIRGAAPRYWEDVTVGEPLPEVVKGPLTVTSVIAFVQGWGSLYVRAHGLAFDLFERHPALGIPNEFGVPEPPERVHWDADLARAVGVPAPYDYGPERVAWLGHLVTNWMGDAGTLARLNVQVRRHNLIGDTTWCRRSGCEI